MSPIKLVKNTKIIHITELSIPRALASFATHTSNAILRTKKTIGTKTKVPQAAHPAAEAPAAAAGSASTPGCWLTKVAARANMGTRVVTPTPPRHRAKLRTSPRCFQSLFIMSHPFVRHFGVDLSNTPSVMFLHSASIGSRGHVDERCLFRAVETSPRCKRGGASSPPQLVSATGGGGRAPRSKARPEDRVRIAQSVTPNAGSPCLCIRGERVRALGSITTPSPQATSWSSKKTEQRVSWASE